MAPTINSSPKKLNFLSHVKYEHMIAGVSGKYHDSFSKLNTLKINY